jgi:hypothetical protein
VKGPRQAAPLPGTEARPDPEAPSVDVPAAETEPEGAQAAAIAAAVAAEAAHTPEVPAAPERVEAVDPRVAIQARARELRNADIAESRKDLEVQQLDTFAGKPPTAAAPTPDNSTPATEKSKDPALSAGPAVVDGIKISVYGEEQVVSEDDVRAAGIATLQKERAAEYRLQQASKQENDLRKYHRELDAYKAELEEQAKKLRAGHVPDAKAVAALAAPPATTGASEGAVDAKLAEGARKFTEAVYRGDTAETQKALQSLLADVAQGRSATPPPVDVQAVAEAAADVLAKRSETSTAEQQRQAVNRTFATEFKAVVSHPEAFLIAKARFDAMLADPDNTGKPLEDLAREAGKAALHRYPELRPEGPGESNVEPVTPAARVTKTLEERRTVKAKTVVRPSGSSARAPAPTPQPVRTNKQFIADMRKSRGLPSL